MIQFCLVSMLSVFVVATIHGAVPTAEVSVGGYGFFGNRRLNEALQLLQSGDQPPKSYNANYIEDAALILMSSLHRDGYLHPRVRARLTLLDGSSREFVWETTDTAKVLPRPLAVKRAQFVVHKGVLYHYRAVNFTGLQQLRESEALQFFIETSSLIPLATSRIYTPTRLKQSLAALRKVLVQRGYENARVMASETRRDDRSGAVSVQVEVFEGVRTMVRSVQVKIIAPATAQPVATRELRPKNQPYSRSWHQDLTQELRVEQYRLGYADATVSMTPLKRTPVDNHEELELIALVETGPQFRVGVVRFEGQHATRITTLARHVTIAPGNVLNRTAVEESRFRLSRLGIFESIGTHYESVDETTRDIVYELREARSFNVNLLLGYGSYELVRGGIEIEERNVFGLAQQVRVRAIQSFKSTSGDLSYTVPNLFNTEVDLFSRVDALRRDEISFIREEFETTLGARRYIELLKSRVSARYSLQFLNASDTSSMLVEGTQDAQASAIIFEVNHEQLDNLLTPRAGRRLFASLELADDTLGGEVDYQRFILTAAWHRPLLNTLILHMGLSHGVALTLNASDDELPFNKRFFLGGENSIRGYREGEAAPFNPDGEIAGAETYTLGNIELEQRLTPAWSLVLFVDTLGFARNVKEWPVDDVLLSIGGGLRWNTLIGPVRLEYGHNLNPRRHDPDGTLHLSVGFPF